MMLATTNVPDGKLASGTPRTGETVIESPTLNGNGKPFTPVMSLAGVTVAVTVAPPVRTSPAILTTILLVTTNLGLGALSSETPLEVGRRSTVTKAALLLYGSQVVN